jgi:hypothetical protein
MRCDRKVCGCHSNSFIWYSHKLRCVYYETPKAACTSIKKALGIKVRRGGNLPPVGVYAFGMFGGTFQESSDQFPDYYKFSFVRDPVSRTVSNYLMFTHQRANQMKELFGVNKIPFEEFVTKLSVVANHHWAPYADYLPRPELLDKLGRLESIQTDWKEICAALGITVTLPHENKSQKSAIDVSDHVRTAIRTVYERDYALFYPSP